jgi:periplasmic protein TonB
MSDSGSLAQCMMDGARETRVQRRALRGRALAVSILFQGIVMTALILWPLMAPPALPRTVAVMPVPPFHGMPAVSAPHPEENPQQAPAITTTELVFTQPAHIPSHTVSTSVAEPPNIPMSPGGTRDGLGVGTWIPGGSDNGPTAPERPSPPPRVVRLSSGVMAASLLHGVYPEYPKIAWYAHISGAVRLHAIIGTDGAVQQIGVISGNGILAQAAVEAVRQWRYRPTLLNGQPVEVDTEITVTFSLE